jgi:hypothetical protein
MRSTIIKPLLLFVILSITIFLSCNKEPGPGGRAMVKGKLYSGNYHSPEVEIDSKDVEADERVYIVYGDREDGAFDDDVRTSHDGSFEFKYLRKGTYKIFAYGKDPELPSSSSKTPVIRTFEITDSKEAVEINDLKIFKEADKGGTSSIRGKVFVQDYNGTFTQLRGEFYSGDEVVYIRYGRDVTYNDRIRTANDGSYEFKNLRKGRYQVYAFSKDKTQQSPSGQITVLMDVEITERNQVIELPDLVIVD